jgi:hypothetical protein
MRKKMETIFIVTALGDSESKFGEFCEAFSTKKKAQEYVDSQGAFSKFYSIAECKIDPPVHAMSDRR